MNHFSFFSPSEQQHRQAENESQREVKQGIVQPLFCPPADRRARQQPDQIHRREGNQARPLILGKVPIEIRPVDDDSHCHVQTIGDENAVNANRTNQDVEETEIDQREDRNEIFEFLQLFNRHRCLSEGFGDAVHCQEEQINAIETK